MNKDQKHNRRSIRLPEYDYSTPWWYYVTICTYPRRHTFGKIVRGKMQLNGLGEIAKRNWLTIPDHFPNTELDEFIIMPNHIHGIIIINEHDVGDAYNASPNNYSGDAKFASPTPDRTKMLLPKIIQQYKRQCTVDIKTIDSNIEKVWQRSYWERVIRNDRELYLIQKYIQQNPLKWALEKGEIENLDI